MHVKHNNSSSETDPPHIIREEKKTPSSIRDYKVDIITTRGILKVGYKDVS